MISPERQVFRCFGCGESGDAISFIQKMEGLSFPEALKILADRVGIQLEFSSNKDFQKQKSEKEKLFRINLLSAKYFKAMLSTKEGKPAMDYLSDRGLTKEVIERFRIGFANSPDRLEKILLKEGFSYKDLSNAGNPQRFRHRIMFPIFSVFGEVVGFSGRILESVLPEGVSPHPKYLNTPETPIFHKSKILYGLNLAKDQIRKTKRAIVVEGQMDVAMSHVAGVENVVASSGTALTEEHLKILGRYTTDIVFAFDEDEAGQKAARSAVIEAYKLSLEPKLTIIEGFKDVGELAQTKPAEWAKIVASALPAVDWLIKTHGFPIDNPSAEQKKNLTKEALVFISNMPDEIEKAHYVDRLSKVIGVPQISVEKALAKVAQVSRSKKHESQADLTAQYSEPLNLERQLVSVVLLLPNLATKITLPDVEFSDNNYQEIYTKVKSCYNQPSKDMANCLRAIRDELPREAQELFAVSAVAWDKTVQESESIALAEFEALIKKILSSKRELLKTKYATAIAEAEKSGDIAKVKQLMQSLQQNL
jgi:DNA primase